MDMQKTLEQQPYRQMRTYPQKHVLPEALRDAVEFIERARPHSFIWVILPNGTTEVFTLDSTHVSIENGVITEQSFLQPPREQLKRWRRIMRATASDDDIECFEGSYHGGYLCQIDPREAFSAIDIARETTF